MSSRKKDQDSHLREVFFFLLVGGVSTVFNYLVFWICLDFFRAFYILANWTGYLAGVILGFFLNSRFTFRAEPQRSGRRAVFYLGVYLASLGLSTFLLYILVDGLGISAKAANLLAILQSTCTNYLGCKFWVFKKKGNETRDK